MIGHLTTAYRQAQNRLLLLDYDGTLVDFTPTPAEAVPGPNLLQTLGRLTDDARNSLAIISGRDRHALETWLGQLPATLVAEHGYFIRPPGGDWEAPNPMQLIWKESAVRAMRSSVDRVPGSFIEEKESAVVWHNRAADVRLASVETTKLLAQLEDAARAHRLVVQAGNRIVEARLADTNKGTAARRLVANGQWDFILAAGDDATDEDLFAAVPDNAFTIKIGAGKTLAHHRVPSPKDFVELLDRL